METWVSVISIFFTKIVPWGSMIPRFLPKHFWLASHISPSVNLTNSISALICTVLFAQLSWYHWFPFYHHFILTKNFFSIWCSNRIISNSFCKTQPCFNYDLLSCPILFVYVCVNGQEERLKIPSLFFPLHYLTVSLWDALKPVSLIKFLLNSLNYRGCLSYVASPLCSDSLLTVTIKFDFSTIFE